MAWLFKLLILKYGGAPYFLGLILGETVVIGTWLGIDFLMGESGNRLSAM